MTGSGDRVAASATARRASSPAPSGAAGGNAADAPREDKAKSSLIDPKDLTPLERRALEDVTLLQLRRTRGGYSNVNCKPVPLKVAEKLERLRLIRPAFDKRRGAHTLVATGLGLTILEIIRQRRERKAQ